MIRPLDTPLRLEVLGTLLAQSYVPHSNLRASSVLQKRASLQAFERYLSRLATIADLDRETVVAFLNWYGREAEPSTVAAKRKDLLALWSHAFEEGLTSAAPFKIKPVRVPHKEPEGLTEAELRDLLAACERLPGVFRYCGDRKRRANVPQRIYFPAYIRCFLSTGLRRSAMLAVKRADVRRDRTFVARWEASKTWIEQTKQLDDVTWRALEDLHRFGPFDRLLPSPTRKYVDRAWGDLLELAGFERSRYMQAQMLRRVAASYKELQEPGSATDFLGHKTPGLAKRSYLIKRIVRPQICRGPSLNL